MYIDAKLYEAQKSVISGTIYWNDPLIEKFGLSPICVVDFNDGSTPISFGTQSKPYRKIEFTF